MFTTTNDANNTNSRHNDTPPPSSSSSSSASSSSSSDIAMHCETTTSDNVKTLSAPATDEKSEEDALLKEKALASSADRTQHRMHHTDLRKEHEQTTTTTTASSGSDYLLPSSKLWQTILVGADKLEIFGSIHVRSNNVRLLSCLIDEQLSLDSVDSSLSFSSAASISSGGGSCSSKLLCSKNAKLAAASNFAQKFIAESATSRLIAKAAALHQVNATAGRYHQQAPHSRHHRRHSNHHQYRSSQAPHKQQRHSNSNSNYRHVYNTQRCCQTFVNGAGKSYDVYARKAESQAAKVTPSVGGSRRKHANIFATPRVSQHLAYTDSEQNEYVDEEHLENEHDAVIVSGNAQNVVAASQDADYIEEDYEDDLVMDGGVMESEYSRFNKHASSGAKNGKHLKKKVKGGLEETRYITMEYYFLNVWTREREGTWTLILGINRSA